MSTFDEKMDKFVLISKSDKKIVVKRKEPPALLIDTSLKPAHVNDGAENKDAGIKKATVTEIIQQKIVPVEKKMTGLERLKSLNFSAPKVDINLFSTGPTKKAKLDVLKPHQTTAKKEALKPTHGDHQRDFGRQFVGRRDDGDGTALANNRDRFRRGFPSGGREHSTAPFHAADQSEMEAAEYVRPSRRESDGPKDFSERTDLSVQPKSDNFSRERNFSRDSRFSGEERGPLPPRRDFGDGHHQGPPKDFRGGRGHGFYDGRRGRGRHDFGAENRRRGGGRNFGRGGFRDFSDRQHDQTDDRRPAAAIHDQHRDFPEDRRQNEGKRDFEDRIQSPPRDFLDRDVSERGRSHTRPAPTPMLADRLDERQLQSLTFDMADLRLLSLRGLRNTVEYLCEMSRDLAYKSTRLSHQIGHVEEAMRYCPKRDIDEEELEHELAIELDKEAERRANEQTADVDEQRKLPFQSTVCEETFVKALCQSIYDQAEIRKAAFEHIQLSANSESPIDVKGAADAKYLTSMRAFFGGLASGMIEKRKHAESSNAADTHASV